MSVPSTIYNYEASKLRNDLLNKIIWFVYGPVHEHFNKFITNLAVRNAAILMSSETCFLYKGNVYGAELRRVHIPKSLVPQLHLEMDAMMEELREIENEKSLVKNYLRKAINRINTVNEMFCIFPDFLHPVLKDQVTFPTDFFYPVEQGSLSAVKKACEPGFLLCKQRLTANLLY